MIKNRSGIVHPWLYKSAIEPVFSNTHSREPKHFGWIQPAVSWGWNSSSLVDNGNLLFCWHGTFGCEQPWEQMSVWSQAAVYKKAGSRESAWRTLSKFWACFCPIISASTLEEAASPWKSVFALSSHQTVPVRLQGVDSAYMSLCRPLVQGLFWTWVWPILFVSVL